MASNTTPTGSDLYGLDQESRQMVLDTVGQLKKRLLTPEKISEYDREEIFPEDTIREMLGPEIGRRVDVVGVGPSRIDLDSLREPPVFHQLAERAFRCRRPADVTQTNKQDFNHAALPSF